MNNEKEKLHASIEALEQLLGLTGKQNDTDANWARHLLSMADKQRRNNKQKQASRFSPQILSIKKEDRPSAYKGPERRNQSTRRQNSNRSFATQNRSHINCRRVNRDRRKSNTVRKFMDLS
jgi:hypothetical protein